MAIAPDEKELLELESNVATALLDDGDTETADESLWQQDRASAISHQLQGDAG